MTGNLVFQLLYSHFRNTGRESPQNFFYSFLLLLAAIASASIAAAAWKRRSIGYVAPAVALFMLASAWWGLTYALHWSGYFRPFDQFWLYATYLGVVIVPTTFLVFVLHFTGNGHKLTRRIIVLLAIEPVLTLIMLWTDKLHGLFFAGMEVGNSSAILDGGSWFWLNVIYSYLLILTAVVLLVRFAGKAKGIYRKQAVFILLGSLIPWVSSAVGIADMSPVSDLDLTPFAFTLTGIAFAYALFRLNLLNIVPVARDALVEIMTDGFFVVDLKHHVVDINLAAQELLGLSKASIGRNAEELFRNTPYLVELYRNEKEGQFEFFTEFYGQRHLDMRVVPLYDRRNEYTGRLFIVSFWDG